MAELAWNGKELRESEARPWPSGQRDAVCLNSMWSKLCSITGVPQLHLTITAQRPVSVTLCELQLDAHSILQRCCVSPSGFPTHIEQITSKDWRESVSFSSLVFF